MGELEEQIRLFYKAILNTEDLPFPYNNFPHGCCQDASWILHRYLFEKGYTSIDLVGGEYHGDNGEFMSHVWLELDGTIIDITYSQFIDEVSDVVITENRNLHQKFIENYRYRKPYWETYTDGHTSDLLDHFYNNVIENVNVTRQNYEP
ncbi:hypothetical protein [Cohnella fermenti]|uniref:Uncharacterized protein n=1 Tax=Cohnella fermenti TaxID=2565925 RepID=A0A4S4BIF7_9BACL|nr:hypothetical protein [Cohnella fermenti]THF74401.1 hypothetical protein E6C55_25505 [Cohnella fermenti]